MTLYKRRSNRGVWNRATWLESVALALASLSLWVGCDDEPEREEQTAATAPRVTATSVGPSPTPTPPPTVTPASITEQTAPAVTPAVPISTVSEPSPMTGSGSATHYYGEISLEEMIAYHPTVVKARLDSITSETGQFLDSNWPSSYGKYFIVLKFNLTITEYLKGTGLTNIVAVWISHSVFATNAEAEAAIPTELAARDDQWDDRESLFFLSGAIDPPYPSSLRAAGYYFLSAGLGHEFEDRYTINSDWRKAWLPAAKQASPAGDSQEFLTRPAASRISDNYARQHEAAHCRDNCRVE